MGHGGTEMGGGGSPSAPSSSTMGHEMSMPYTHMTFFWGKDSEILFKGWPGRRGGMYALALSVVFLLAVLVEWFNGCARVRRSGLSRTAKGVVQTAMHAVRVALMYLLMLALMSFNVGVLIVAVAGHAVGFLLFGGALCNKESSCGEAAVGDLPPMKC